MLQAFAQGVDVHRAHRRGSVWHFFGGGHRADQRRNAKAINFGLMYGMSSFGLSQQLGISRDEAQQSHRYLFSKISASAGIYGTGARAGGQTRLC